MKIKRLYDNAILPTRGSEDAAGHDLYLCTDVNMQDMPIIFEPGATIKCKTGVAIALDKGTAALILPRSGLATKQGLRPANTPGLIDADYRGEVIVALHNDSDKNQTIHYGDRIAQMVVIPYITDSFEETDNLDNTERGTGGFGSTGV